MSSAKPSLRASLRMFRLAMSEQRRAEAAAATAAAAPVAAAAAAAGAAIARGAAATAAATAAGAGATTTPSSPLLLAAGRMRSSFAGGLSGRPMAIAAAAPRALPPLPLAAAAAAAATAATTSPSSSSSFPAPRAFHSTSPAAATAGVRLNDLHPALGATKAVRRVGRGDGSGRGKTCGRGTKGQGARKGNKPGLLFDGGTRQLRKWPKVHARPTSPVAYDYVNVSDIAAAARAGLLGGIDFSSSSSAAAAASSGGGGSNDGGGAPAGLPLVTMKHLRDAGLVSKSVRWGVKLLARAPDAAGSLNRPPRLPAMRLQVSAASAAARRAVEAAGGRVEAVYYNRLGLRALLKPEAWEREGRPLPRGVRAWAPRDEGKFDGVGALPPRPIAAAAATATAGAAAAL